MKKVVFTAAVSLVMAGRALGAGAEKADNKAAENTTTVTTTITPATTTTADGHGTTAKTKAMPMEKKKPHATKKHHNADTDGNNKPADTKTEPTKKAENNAQPQAQNDDDSLYLEYDADIADE